MHQTVVSEAEKTVVREQLRTWKQTQPKIALKVTPAAVCNTTAGVLHSAGL